MIAARIVLFALTAVALNVPAVVYVYHTGFPLAPRLPSPNVQSALPRPVADATRARFCPVATAKYWPAIPEESGI